MPLDCSRLDDILGKCDAFDTRQNSLFQKGAGVFKCQECGKNTRHTSGGDRSHRLCPTCYKVAQEENEEDFRRWKRENEKADSDFKESDHPRDSDGKFGSGGGGGSKLSGERLNSGGKPDPDGKFIASPLKPLKGSDIRGALRDVSHVTVKAYGKKEKIDPGEVMSSQKTVNPDKVSEYQENPDKTPDVAKGRPSSDVIVARRNGKLALIDGNHRIVAAKLNGKPIEVTVVDMDALYEDVKRIQAEGEKHLGTAILKAQKEKLGSEGYDKSMSEIDPHYKAKGDEASKPQYHLNDPILPSPMIRASGILFVAPGNKVLLCHRTDGTGWAFPGGGIEGDETPEEAARRECKEETGLKYPGPLNEWTRRIKDGCDFTTFVAQVEEFDPKLNSEHDAFQWVDRMFALNSVELHPGVNTSLLRFDLDELGIAKAIRAGELTSPQHYGNMMLIALRITGTGAAYRPTIEEFVWRDPTLYLNQEFLDRCNGLPVIWAHPEGNIMNSKDFSERIVGTVLLPYIEGDEVWGIAKIYDKAASGMLQGDLLSTSPGVYLESQAKYKMEGGEKLIVEGKASIIDHIAICQVGVWDKGAGPTGVLNDATNSTVGVFEMAEEDKGKADAGITNSKEGDKLDKILSHLDSLHKRMDACDSRLDSWDNKAKKDAEDEENLKKELKESKADKKKADAEEQTKEQEKSDKAKKDAEFKAKKDAEDEEKEMKAKKDAEDEEKAKADSAISARIDELARRIPVELPEADRARLVEAQSKAERVAQAFGDSAPRWTNSESEVQYRVRLANKFKMHSKDWKDIDLAKLGADALTIAENSIYADAWSEATRPASIEGGTLREVTETDRTGRKITRFYGDAEVCWGPFKQPGRLVTGWNTKFN